MRIATKSPYWLVLGSFFIALIFEVLPLPHRAQLFRPEIFYLVMIYWTIYSPLRLGLSFAFLSGILLDIMQGNVLGLHSVIMVALVVFMFVFCQRVRMFDLWKQCLLIFGILCITNFIYAIFQAILPSFQEIMIPALMSILFWPGLVMLLSNADKNTDSFYQL